MTNLTRQEIIEFGERLNGVQVKVSEGELFICTEDGAGLYHSTDDTEAYSWLCGYSYSHKLEEREDRQ